MMLAFSDQWLEVKGDARKECSRDEFPEFPEKMEAIARMIS